MDYQSAQDRATELLLEHLNSRQRADYKRGMAFTVVAPSGNRYRLRYGEMVKAQEQFNSYGEERQLCLISNATYRVPEPDRLLAIMMLIHSDEQHMLNIAG